MSRPYDPRIVLHHLPVPLLRRFAASERIPFAIDWDAAADDPDAVVAAWLALPPDEQTRAELMLAHVHQLATPDAVRVLAAEAAFQGCPVATDPADGLHARALRTLLDAPVVFDHVRLIRDAGPPSGRSWHRVVGLPKQPADGSAQTCHRLALALAEYFRETQARGHRVTVEHCGRSDGTQFFFCFPDDYTHTHLGHDPRGTLRRTPLRPAFEVVFVFDPAAGTVDAYAPGPLPTRVELVDRFCQTVLAAVPPVEQPHDPPFELNRLLDSDFAFPTDPADGIARVRVKRLRLAAGGRDWRIVVEDPTRGATAGEAVRTALAEVLPASAGTRDRLNVTQATLTFVYRPAGATRDRTLTFDVAFPRSCTLKNRTDDQRVLGEKYLRAWGIARAD